MASCSGRILAQSASRAYLRPVVLDLYADADTQACSSAVAAIPADGMGFDQAALLDCATRLAPPAHYPLIYGSGVDKSPDLLEKLAAGRELIGNTPDVQRLLRSPQDFFSLLDDLEIEHPEVRFERPLNTDNWLIKAGCGEGGKRVRFCAQESAEADEYFQRRLPGDALSVLFLADGRHAQIIGFNTQWTVATASRPFLFGGAINRASLTPLQRNRVTTYVEKLVSALALRGLNSLDFMMDGSNCKILELNGRPSATLCLYDADFPEGLLAAHIWACRGSLDATTPHQSQRVRAFRVFFAPSPARLSAEDALPDWCADRPVNPADVIPAQPFCTITAEGQTIRETQELLQARENWLNHFIFQPNHCPENRPCNPMSA